MVDLLTDTKCQAQALAGLDLLTAPESLESHLQVFLLSCRVDGLSSSTISNYQYQVGYFVKFCHQINVTATKSITTQHLRLFLLSLQERNNATSIRDYRKSINRFFNWLVAEKILKETPMQNIRSPKIEERIVKPFSHQDIDNLLLLCSGSRFLDLRNRALILVFLDTGLRNREMAGIQLNDVNFDRETIKVMGKGAKERVVRIGKTAQKALLKYLLSRSDKLPCLWVNEERRCLTGAGIQCTIKKFCQRAGVIDAKRGPHSFRHTFAINFLRNGGG